MPQPLFWTQERLAKAAEMNRAGFTYGEIGRMWGKTGGAVSDAVNRYRNTKVVTESYFDGPAIGLTHEDVRLRENAIHGSARLLAEIERVFGA